MIALHVMRDDMVLEAASTAHAVATAPLVDTPQWPISLAPLQTTAWHVMQESTVQEVVRPTLAVATVRWVDTPQWPISLGLEHRIA